MKLAGVGDPFINKYQAGGVFIKEFFEAVAGIGGFFVILFEQVVACPACRRRFRGQDGFVRCCGPVFTMPESKPQNTRQRNSRDCEY